MSADGTVNALWGRGTRLGSWVLQHRVGRGTFGEVWRANHHLFDHRLAAVKIPTESVFIRLLQSEALAVELLSHPNIVALFDADPFSDPPYLAMEFIQGTTLSDFIPQAGLPVETSARIAKQLLSALGYAHEHGVIHYDVKPQNVLLDEEGRVKLADFGLGKCTHAAQQSVLQSISLNRSDSSSLRGTLAYMPPELLQGEGGDHRCDIYSFGVIWFQLLTGRLPAGRDELPSTVQIGLAASCDEVYTRATASLSQRAQSTDDLLPLIETVLLQVRAMGGDVSALDGQKRQHGLDGFGKSSSEAARVETKLIDSPRVACEERARCAELLGLPLTWTDHLGIVFSLIPPGRFWMGAANEEEAGTTDERPQQLVSISEPMYAATFPITNHVVSMFLRAAASDSNAAVRSLARDRSFAQLLRAKPPPQTAPCVYVSACDVEWICAWLQLREEVDYRLPTEAEWEYMARAGTGSNYWWKDGACAGNCAVFDSSGPQLPELCRANAWGLIDVLGNVAEWTSSRFAPLDSDAKYISAPRPLEGSLVVRGGNWACRSTEALRVCGRYPKFAGLRSDQVGARLVFAAECLVRRFAQATDAGPFAAESRQREV